MAFLDILPDPNNPITYSGSAYTGGTDGPGFASVKLSSMSPTAISKTHSGRIISRRLAAQTWNIGITYNPLTRNEFEPIYNFLLMRGRLTPFFVELPQHLTSRNTGTLPTNMLVAAGSAGATNLTVTGFSSDTYSDKPLPGDIFTITDTGDSLHTKAYRVTRVEVRGTDEQEYEGTAPTTNTARIWLHPPLQRQLGSNTSSLNFGQTATKKPKIRVIMTKDVTEYSLGTNNLYQFGLSLTEANA